MLVKWSEQIHLCLGQTPGPSELPVVLPKPMKLAVQTSKSEEAELVKTAVEVQ